jgi:hypothetical protein
MDIVNSIWKFCEDKINKIDYDLLQNISIVILLLLCIWLIYINVKKSHFLFLTQVRIGFKHTFFLWELNKDDLFKKMLEENLHLKKENELLESRYKNLSFLNVGSLIGIILLIVITAKNSKRAKLFKNYDEILDDKEKEKIKEESQKITIGKDILEKQIKEMDEAFKDLEN